MRHLRLDLGLQLTKRGAAPERRRPFSFQKKKMEFGAGNEAAQPQSDRKGTAMQKSPFELLELPDGRCCVARPAAFRETGLVAGSFARIETADAGTSTPVGVYPSRSAAELAVQRAAPAPAAGTPLAPFAAWLRPS